MSRLPILILLALSVTLVAAGEAVAMRMYEIDPDYSVTCRLELPGGHCDYSAEIFDYSS